MDYIQAAGMILAVWAVLRSIGNERECGLREIEIRIREEATDNQQPAEVKVEARAVDKPASAPPTKPKPK